MKRFVDFYKKHTDKFYVITIFLLVILFCMPFITTKRMDRDASYTNKEDVALYVMQYHELPKNFITNYGYDYIKNHGLETTDKTMMGRDTHINDGSLKSFGVDNDSVLKECDVSGSNYTIQNRGRKRLVYTCNTKKVRVFYTSDHYSSFVEITEFKLQLTRNIFWIIFACYTLVFVIFYICMVILQKKYSEQNLVTKEI